ncbi:DNA-3-methyladenine glycosylase II [Georgenia muralis]|uniref:DNA-3-methyladenine glycosylase II n=1 Tax=Georgenia muralis TaxID=154117 RepID=A0A3N4ZC29_9MICO|nr:DNA-3-methyladenine glycosylase II [Georgenia muralis]
MDVLLPAATPLAVGPILAALAAHAVPGVEEVDRAAGSVRRTVRGAHGPAVVSLRLTPTAVRAEVALAHPGDGDAVVARLRRWFDLDTDVAAVDAHLATDAVLAPLVAARPGLRVLGHVDGFEAAATTVLGQQVSLAAARTFAARLVAALGGPVPATGSGGAGLRTFPSPEVLADAGASVVREATGVTGSRARTLHALATACAAGLRIEPDQDPVATRAALLAVPGVGPWTVDYLALRAMGDRDALPSGDLVLRRALGGASAAAAVAAAGAWRPWRAYAVTHLWTAAAYLRRAH